MPNSTYISANDPVIENNDSKFTRSWFRFFDTVSKKVSMLDGTQSTSATTGAASALPILPAGYMTIIGIDGNEYKVPYYNA